ncbi:MAG: phosphoribosylformylglycinamidine synthase I, partial [Candidatus Thermoplasmatota archaeon]|nr:phosphoribosylformylglycinamidine synthase I [Candidatus Thermoplasmatota archaeon]
CVLRAPGTNCDIETRQAFLDLGATAEVVRIDRLSSLPEYHGLVIPGGFSYGDHVRSGAIMGKVMGKKFGALITAFAEEGKPILGICNGFQVLSEAGLLPGYDSGEAQMALGRNASSGFECRWSYLRMENKGRCVFTKGLPQVVRIPVAHGEGKVIFPPGREEEYLQRLEAGDQMAFRYSTEDGVQADGRYPENPNGSFDDIAGICDSKGTILGMMPHPERAFHRIAYPDWTRTGLEDKGDGYLIFKNMLEYAGSL